MENRISKLAWLLTFICLTAATALLVAILNENVLASSGGSVTYYTMSSPPSVTGGGGSISVSPYSSTYTYANGTNLTVTFNNELTPDGSIDYRLDNWYDLPSTQFPSGPLGPGTSVANPVYMTVVNTVPPKAKAVPHYRLIVNKVGLGEVEPGGGYRKEDPPLTMIATPEAGWRFDHWEGALTGNQTPTQLVMNGPKTVTAVFLEDMQFALTTAASPSNAGTVSPAGTTYHTSGAIVQISAEPAQGWRFDHWEGGVAGTTNPADLAMDGNKTVTTFFLQLPQADFTANPTSGTVPFYILFTDTSLPGTIGTNPLNSWAWDFQSDGIFDSTARHVIKQFITPGAYDVTLRVTAAAGDVSTTTKTGFITANGALPSANFTAVPLDGVAPLAVSFTDTSIPGSSPITNWQWDFENDGAVDSTEQNPTHTFNTVGSYTISLKVTTQYGNDIEAKDSYVTVDAPPQAEFSATPTSGPEPLLVNFTDLSYPGTGTITSWLWDFGNGETSPLPNPQCLYTPGLYAVSLTVATDHGQDTTTKNEFIFVYSLPIADFIADVTSGAAPLTVHFTDLSTPGLGAITSWAWDFNGDGIVNSTDQNPTYTYIESGTYSVTLAATDTAGSDTETKFDYITAEGAPTIATFAASPSSVQIGSPITLSWTTVGANTCVIEPSNLPGCGAVAANGSIELALNGSTTFDLTAANTAGVATRRVHVTVLGNPLPLPEGSFGEQYQDHVPPDATLESFDPGRFALVTGKVEDAVAVPLADVAVTVPSAPEYGTAYTDSNGIFRIPIEGGGITVLNYSKEGYLVAQRQVDVPWTNLATVETVTLLQADPNFATITLDGNPDTIITYKSTETPATATEGARACTLVFSGDTKAFQVDANDRILQELHSFKLRVKEYETPGSMPAELPPTTAFTYCAEFSVDGAANVLFDRPVQAWVDNFLGFTIGGVVPFGYYDRAKQAWIPSDNGLVVRMLDTDQDGFIDALDSDGDGLPDDLNKNGQLQDEVAGFTENQLDLTRDSFWRVPLRHFSPGDKNWRFQPVGDGPPDPGRDPDGDEDPGDPTRNPDDCPGCYVDYREGAFHEDVPIPGSGLALHYSNQRVSGYKKVFHVPVTGDVVPDSLLTVDVEVRVAGRVLTEHLEALAPNMAVNIPWDGLDVNGNPFWHASMVKVRLGYQFPQVYSEDWDAIDKAFASLGGDWENTTIAGRNAVKTWKTVEIPVVPTRGDFAEGWTISAQHHLEPPVSFVLHKGDGSLARSESSVIRIVAGTGMTGTVHDGSAIQNLSLSPTGLCADRAGNFYFISNGHVVCRVNAYGILTKLTLPNQTSYLWPLGDGGPSTNATTNNPCDLAADGAGNLFIADYGNSRIRKIDPQGIITTVAEIPWPVAVVADSFGSLYVVTQDRRIVNVTPAGDKRDVLPSATWSIRDVAVDPEGNLLYLYADRYIMKINAVGDGTPYQIHDFRNPNDEHTDISVNRMAIDRCGKIYVSSANTGWRVSMLSPTGGNRQTVVGNGTYATSFSGDGGPAAAATCVPTDVAVDPGGSILIITNGVYICKSNPPFPAAGAAPPASIVFADENGLRYEFGQDWLHETTIDAKTGLTLLTFDYDQARRLTSITDYLGNITTIQRDAQGAPAAIISPDGVTTALVVDSNNHLTDVVYPDGGYYEFTYTADGLLTDENVNGRLYVHSYDQYGHVTAVQNPLNDVTSYGSFSAGDGGQVFQRTTVGGDATQFKDRYDAGEFTSVTTDPDGAVTTYVKAADEIHSTNTMPDGMIINTELGFDPIQRVNYPKTVTALTPGGLTFTATTDRQKTDSVFTETVTVNGRTSTSVDDVVLGSITVTSPVGRTSQSHYNPQTLLLASESTPGLLDSTYTYDARGRVIGSVTGARQVTFAYDAQGNVDSVSSPATGTAAYDYDPVGRVTAVLQPDAHSVAFAYDLNGNLTSLTTPSGQIHSFTYNPLSLQTSYTTPLGNTYTYGYDADKRPVSVTLPSAAQITTSYSLGHVSSITTPEGTTAFNYDAAGRVQSVAKGAESVAYTYDGPLPTSITFAGVLNQTVTTTYNNDFLPVSVTYAGVATDYAYDNDGLVTQAGPFAITLDTQNGLPTSVSDGTAVMTPGYNGYGEVTSATTTVNGFPVAAMSLEYDNAGRIIAKIETLGAATSSFAYTYDAMNRLDTVTRDGILVEDYDYDPQGRRVRFDNSLRGIVNRTAAYDNDDRLVTSGDYAYAFDADGFLTARTDMTTQQTTTYAYARTGQLNSVTLSDGTLVEYVHNAVGQRIAKKVNGAITEKYLWAGVTGLLAVYDAADNLLIRFEGAKMVKNGQTYYLITDQVGSVRAVADAAGNIVKEITYDSFGNILADTNPAFTIPLGFAGGLQDHHTGLIRFGFRDYDPDSGTWTAKDPVGLNGPVYLYGYCNQNPICLTDSFGLKWGWNVIGSAVSEGFSSITESLLSIKSLGFLGRSPMCQAASLRDENLLKATKISYYGGVGALAGALTLGAAAPTLASTPLTQLPFFAETSGQAISVPGIIAAAKEQYPKLIGSHWHHIVPKYLTGVVEKAQVYIPAAYHQLITNNFRELWAYGQNKLPNPAELQEILRKVYESFPVDCFPRR